MAEQVRLVSYNIHQCVGRDGHCDPARIAAVLRALDADVYALQEVGACRGEEQNRGQLEYLAAALAAAPLPGATLWREDTREYYGNALLSRHPVEHWETLDLSEVGREPRGAVRALLDIRGRPLDVTVTHLGLRAEERRRQVERLAAYLKRRATPAQAVAGDFNEWIPWSRALRRLQKPFKRLPQPVTFPAALPLLSLDRIWLTPALEVLEIKSHRRGAARLASDHLPLSATFMI